jgi:DNA-binding HxlR family transcriptional regulator
MKTTQESQCHVDVTLSVIGGKWKPVILWHLTQGTFRFSELSKRIPGISQKMLAQQLREMERDQLVNRKMYPVVPPKVEYSMTDHGKSLRDVLRALGSWGEKHLKADQQ